jgi:hypothetical protein
MVSFSAPDPRGAGHAGRGTMPGHPQRNYLRCVTQGVASNHSPWGIRQPPAVLPDGPDRLQELAHPLGTDPQALGQHRGVQPRTPLEEPDQLVACRHVIQSTGWGGGTQEGAGLCVQPSTSWGSQT